MPTPALITQSPDEAIRIFQKAVAQGKIDPQDRGEAYQYLVDYATLEAASREADVDPDIEERLSALREEWLSN